MNQIINKPPAGPITVSKVWENIPRTNEDLMHGVALSFPILAIGTNQWIVRWKGDDRLVTIPNTEYPAPFVDVVILNAQKEMSRVFYATGYVQGQRGKKPDCWSSNGIKPDQEVAQPVNPICATCPNSAWGSGGSPAAPKAQACQQRRRTVVVPYAPGIDLNNEAEGGPMLLSVPPGSLTNQVKYGQDLNDLEMADGSKGIFYAAVVTRLSYEPMLKFSKVVFQFLQPLNDDESIVIRDLREGEATKRILNSKINIDGGEVDQPEGATQSHSQVQTPGAAPKGGAPITPKGGAPTATKVKPATVQQAPAQQAAPQQTKPVGGHPVTGINEAIAQPATPPTSQRVVATAPIQTAEIKHMAPATEDETEAEAMAVVPGIAGVDPFDQLMEQEP